MPEQTVRASGRGDVLVITPGAMLDVRSIEQLDDFLLGAAPDMPVVIDLAGTTLTSRGALDLLDPDRWNRTSEHACLACSRVTGRELITRAAVDHRLAVFHRVEDAIQARVLAHAGYGTGWHHGTAGHHGRPVPADQEEPWIRMDGDLTASADS